MPVRIFNFFFAKDILSVSAAKPITNLGLFLFTAIVFKMIFFPSSAIKLIPFFERVIPFFLGVVVFLIFPQNPNLGLVAGIGSFALTIIYRNYL